MKKNILVLCIGLFSLNSAYSNDFQMFADKSAKPDYKLKTIYEKNLAKALSARYDGEDKNPSIKTLDSESSQRSFNIFESKPKTYNYKGLVSSDIKDYQFYNLINRISELHTKNREFSAKEQAKMKAHHHDIYTLAQQGNENSIDYLCLNPLDSSYIQVDVMKHFCDIAENNNHVELQGYLAWVQDFRPFKVSTTYSDRKEHDLLLGKTLQDNASWALLLETQKVPNELAKQQAAKELLNKKSHHWLHLGAVETLKAY